MFCYSKDKRFPIDEAAGGPLNLLARVDPTFIASIDISIAVPKGIVSPVWKRASLREVSRQALLSVLVPGMAFGNVRQAITENYLIESRGCKSGRDVHEDGDCRVLRESTSPIEDCSHESSPEIASHVGRDGDVGEAPDHGSICKTNDERNTSYTGQL